MPTKNQVIEVLKECYDPEIPADVYSLGLIYGVEIKKDVVEITMTLTSPGCAFGPMLAQGIKEKVEQIKGVRETKVEIVFDPPWGPDKISEEAKLKLGIG